MLVRLCAFELAGVHLRVLAGVVGAEDQLDRSGVLERVCFRGILRYQSR